MKLDIYSGNSAFCYKITICGVDTSHSGCLLFYSRSDQGKFTCRYFQQELGIGNCNFKMCERQRSFRLIRIELALISHRNETSFGERFVHFMLFDGFGKQTFYTFKVRLSISESIINVSDLPLLDVVSRT